MNTKHALTCALLASSIALLLRTSHAARSHELETAGIGTAAQPINLEYSSSTSEDAKQKHSIVVLGCEYSDIDGPPALEQYPSKVWDKQRISDYLDDPEIGLRGFMDMTLGLDLDYHVSDWRSLPHTSDDYNDPDSTEFDATVDCLDIHADVDIKDYDTVVMWFNGSMGTAAGYGGGGFVWLTKHSRPNILVHEWGHAQGLGHYAVVDPNLKLVIDAAPPWSVMYGGGNPCYSYSWPHPEYDCLPNEFSMLDKYDLHLIPDARVCLADGGDIEFELLPWGDQAAGCYLVKIPLNANEFLSLERRPTSSFFDVEYFEEISSGVLVLARFDEGIGPYNSNTAMVSHEKSGWTLDLLDPGESMTVSNIKIAAKPGNKVRVEMPTPTATPSPTPTATPSPTPTATPSPTTSLTPTATATFEATEWVFYIPFTSSH